MDCLPMIEENVNLSYRSTIENRAHMCGHDGHIVMLLSTAIYYISHIRHDVACNRGIRFIFQPAEEGLFGANRMVKAGVMNSVDEVYGLHNYPIFNLGM